MSTAEATVTAPPPRVVRSGEGEARWWAGQLATIKATGAETGGGHTLVEIEVGPGYSTPLHVHHREDEGFWMISGTATFEVGDETVEAGPGDYLFGPRDIPHKWTAGPEGARMLYLFAPSGFEDLIRDMSVPAEALTPPPPEVGLPDDVVEIAARYGNEIIPE